MSLNSCLNMKCILVLKGAIALLRFTSFLFLLKAGVKVKWGFILEIQNVVQYMDTNFHFDGSVFQDDIVLSRILDFSLVFENGAHFHVLP